MAGGGPRRVRGHGCQLDLASGGGNAQNVMEFPGRNQTACQIGPIQGTRAAGGAGDAALVQADGNYRGKSRWPTLAAIVATRLSRTGRSVLQRQAPHRHGRPKADGSRHAGQRKGLWTLPDPAWLGKSGGGISPGAADAAGGIGDAPESRSVVQARLPQRAEGGEISAGEDAGRFAAVMGWRLLQLQAAETGHRTRHPGQGTDSALSYAMGI